MNTLLDIHLRYLALSALAFAFAALNVDNARSFETAALDKPGTFRVELSEDTWNDAQRKREVPVKLYAPRAADSKQKFPVILFSHGLGGSRAAGTLWANHWASHGFIVVSMQHGGSDETLWKGRSVENVESNLKAGMTLSNLGLRVGDVRYVIDDIERRANAGEGIWKNADPSRIGMSGHSFGAQTTLAVTGQKSPNLAGQSGLDSRIAAAIAFSPNARNKSNLARQFGDIRIPFFSVTGTEDGSVLGDGTTWQDRTLPFESMPAGGKYLMVLDGADHSVFGGQEIRRRAKTSNDDAVQRNVRAATLAFWKAHLEGDKSAQMWLVEDFKKSIAEKDRFSAK